MNQKRLVALSIGAMAGLCSQALAGSGGNCTLGSDWQTVDAFLPFAGGISEVHGLANNINGVELAAGYATDSTFSNSKWVVRRSLDQGASWGSSVFGLPGVLYSGASASAAGPSAEFYVAGSGGNKTVRRWNVQNSTDNGASFKTVDSFLPSSLGTSAYADGVSVDGNGVVYVSGYASGGATGAVWLIRRSTDGGATWSTVDTYKVAGDTIPFGIAAANSGEVFAVGRGNNHWLTRYSADGIHWSTVDDVFPVSYAQGNSVAIDSSGNVVTTGNYYDASNNTHWEVRESSLSTPGTWTVIDDYIAPQGGQVAQPFAVTFALDEVFAAGVQLRGTNSTNYKQDYLTRRGSLSGSFENSDILTSALPSNELGFTSNTAYAAMADVYGSVFTGGGVYLTPAAESWVIRRLACEW